MRYAKQHRCPRRGRSTSHRPTLLNRRLCLYGPLCTANFTLMGMLHLIASPSPCVEEICKVRCYRVSLSTPFHPPCFSLSLPSILPFLFLPILSYFSPFFFFFPFNSRKKGVFFKDYRVTYIYIYIYRLIDILTHQAIRSFTFIFILFNKDRCDRVTRVR